MHGYYSAKHAMASFGEAIYENKAGVPIAVTIVFDTKEKGDVFIKTSQYDDYVYVGELGRFLWSPDPDDLREGVEDDRR